MKRLLPLFVALALVGCGKKKPPATSGGVEPSREAAAAARLDRVLTTAVQLEGRSQIVVDGQAHRADCSGFVGACYSAIDHTLGDPAMGGSSGTENIFLTLQSRGGILGPRMTPQPGDLVFFHDTYDRNRNGRRDDRLTHIGLVDRVDADGTVWFFHFASRRVKHEPLNLDHPSEHAHPDTGVPINAWLRQGRGKVMTGQLFFAFGRPLPARRS